MTVNVDLPPAQGFRAEFEAIQTVHAALDPLDDDARARVFSYIASLLDIDLKVAKRPSTTADLTVTSHHGADVATVVDASDIVEAPAYQSFAELYDAVRPISLGEKALAAGYWLQVCNNAESFDAQRANTELKNLGHGVPNITKAIDGLKAQNPALALQLKKAGTSRQARKVYKITVAGVKAIEGLIRAGRERGSAFSEVR